MPTNWIWSFVLVGSFALNGQCIRNYCLDIERRWVLEGEIYTPEGNDYCTKCTCNQGKGEMCISEFCRPPVNCRKYEKVPRTCCQFRCKDRSRTPLPTREDNNEIHNDNNKVPETYVRLRHDSSCYDFKKNQIKDGETFAPKRQDPCLKCTCTDGTPTLCMSVMCQLPRKCKNYEIVSDECCKFNCRDNIETNSLNGTTEKLDKKTNSRDRYSCADWRGKDIKEGQSFQPRYDPCYICSCLRGNARYCKRTECRPPTNCIRYRKIKRECCKYECLDNEESNSLLVNRPGSKPESYIRTAKPPSFCTDHNGRIVKEGDTFVPNKNNFCMKCSCVRGRPRICMSIQCQLPRNCTSYVKVLGKCCKFTCKEQTGDHRLVPTTLTARCRDGDGKLVHEGQTVFSPNHHSCVKCRCINNKLQRCLRIPCKLPDQCQNYERMPGGCCHYKCKDNLEPNVIPRKKIRGPVPEAQIRRKSHENLFCLDSSNRKILEGTKFTPNHLNPCLMCICKRGKPKSCNSIVCNDFRKNCTRFIKVPGKCCEFKCVDAGTSKKTTPWKVPIKIAMKNCTDKNGRMVLHGRQFKHLKRQQCFTCVCNNGKPKNCVYVPNCETPSGCKNNNLGECQDQEQFTKTNRKSKGGAFVHSNNYCMNSSGQIIKIGQLLKLPGDDKCSECFCVGRNQRLCRAIECSIVGKCSNKASDPGSCCGFKCVPGNSVKRTNVLEKKLYSNPTSETTSAAHQRRSTTESRSVKIQDRFHSESSLPIQLSGQGEVLDAENSVLLTSEPDSNFFHETVAATEIIHAENETFSNIEIVNLNSGRNFFQNGTVDANKSDIVVSVTEITTENAENETFSNVKIINFDSGNFFYQNGKVDANKSDVSVTEITTENTENETFSNVDIINFDTGKKFFQNGTVDANKSDVVVSVTEITAENAENETFSNVEIINFDTGRNFFRNGTVDANKSDIVVSVTEITTENAENETFSNVEIINFDTGRNFFQNGTVDTNKTDIVTEIISENASHLYYHDTSAHNNLENTPSSNETDIVDTSKENEEYEREMSSEIPANETILATTKSINHGEESNRFFKVIEAMNSAVKSLGNASSFPFRNSFFEGFKKSVHNAKNLIEEITLKRRGHKTTPIQSQVEINDTINLANDNSNETDLTSSLSKSGPTSSNYQENYSSYTSEDYMMTNSYGNPNKTITISDKESIIFENNLGKTTQKKAEESIFPDKFSTKNEIKEVYRNFSSASNVSDVNLKPFDNSTTENVMIEDANERLAIDLLQDMRNRVKLVIVSSERFRNVSLKIKNITNTLRHEIRKINEEVIKGRRNKSNSAKSIMEATLILKNISLNLKDHLKSAKNMSKFDEKKKTFISKIIDGVKEDINNLTKIKKMEESCHGYDGKLAKEGQSFVKKLQNCLHCICKSNSAKNCSYGICSTSEKCAISGRSKVDLCCQLLCPQSISAVDEQKRASGCAQKTNYVIIVFTASVMSVTLYS